MKKLVIREESCFTGSGCDCCEPTEWSIYYIEGDESGVGYPYLEEALTAYLERFLSIEVDIVYEEEN